MFGEGWGEVKNRLLTPLPLWGISPRIGENDND